MKIVLDLPDWAFEKEMVILSWTELVAHKRPGENWFVKTGRCNKCGECCKNIGPGNPMYNGTSICPKLGVGFVAEKNICTLDVDRPFSCLMNWHDDPELKPKGCTEDFKEIKGTK
jgi:hypothetical protein